MRGRKFLFDNNFDDKVADHLKKESAEGANQAVEEIIEAAPTFSAEELENARSSAYQQGRQDGMADALNGIEKQISLSLDDILNRLPAVFDEQKRYAQSLQDDALKLCQAIMHKLAPALIQSREAVEVEYVVREAFGFLTNQPKVIIRVPEAVEPHLRDKTDLMASRVGYEGEVVLVGDPELDTTDCRISWFAGAVESSRADTWADIDSIVNRALSNDMPPADTITDAPEHVVETPQPNDTEATSDLS